jgi:hypothetical protein
MQGCISHQEQLQENCPTCPRKDECLLLLPGPQPTHLQILPGLLQLGTQPRHLGRLPRQLTKLREQQCRAGQLG